MNKPISNNHQPVESNENSQSDQSIRNHGNVHKSNFIVGNDNIIKTNVSVQSQPRIADRYSAPLYNENFIGRAFILETLHRRFTQTTDQSYSQIQVLCGMGGVGKTQIAIQYAWTYFCKDIYQTVLWVTSDTESTLSAEFSNLASQLGLTVYGATESDNISVVKGWLREHDDWLLVFDNADTPKLIKRYIPANSRGNILITSRATKFVCCNVKKPLVIDVFSTGEALNFLFQRTGQPRTESTILAATALSQELGELPLALEQASAYMVETTFSFSHYLEIYRIKGISHLNKAKEETGNYPLSVLNTWTLNFEAVKAENPASADLLELSAFLAPEDIPYTLLIAGGPYFAHALGERLHPKNTSHIALTAATLSELLMPLNRYSLVHWNRKDEVYSLHRLVQAVIRSNLTPEATEQWIAQAIIAIEHTYPDLEFESWSQYALLLPHSLKVMEFSQLQAFQSAALGTVLNRAGAYLEVQGRYEEAEPLLTESLELHKLCLGEHHVEVAASSNNLALLYGHQGRYQAADKLYLQALKIQQQQLGEADLAVATTLSNQAELYCYQARYTAAEALYQKVLAIQTHQLGEEHATVMTNLNNLATIYNNQGRYLEAGPLYEKALAIGKELFGEEHPEVARSFHNLAGMYHNKGQYEKARPHYHNALRIRQKVFGEEHPDVAVCLYNLGNCYSDQAWDFEAEGCYHKALEIFERNFDESHPNIARVINSLGTLAYNQGLYDKAEALYLKSLGLFRRIFSGHHIDIAVGLENLATLYDVQEKHYLAQHLYRKALEANTVLLGEHHRITQRCLDKMENLASQEP